ncbi:MAG: CARDB domain-containing protein, partial [Candidatus Poseidoniia archaeon]
IQNLGAGSVPDLNVMARADGTLISTKTVSMSPGESFDLSWNWTPTAEGLVDLSFHIDPNDMIEEVSETNNVLTHTIVISAPGVRVTSDEVLMTLGDATDSATSWQLTLTNTALFETNATIAATTPQRMADGLVFDWFYSFTLNTFNLQAAESVSVGFTLVHPAP